MEDYTTSYVSFCAKMSEESNLKSGSDQLPIYRKYKGTREYCSKGIQLPKPRLWKTTVQTQFPQQTARQKETENLQTKRTINQMQRVDLTSQVETASNQATEVNVYL